MKQYAAVYRRPSGGDDGDIIVAGVSNDMGLALQTLADAHLSGGVVVGLFEAVEGEITYTAQFVPGKARNGTNKHPRRKAAKLAPSAKKRTPEQLQQVGSKVLAWLKKHPDSTVEQVSAALSTPTKVLARPLSQLLAAKVVRKRGACRGTRYFAVQAAKAKTVKAKTVKAKTAKAKTAKTKTAKAKARQEAKQEVAKAAS